MASTPRKRPFDCFHENASFDPARMVRQRTSLQSDAIRADASLLDHLSIADRNAFQRVAEIMNQPVAHLLASMASNHNPPMPMDGGGAMTRPIENGEDDTKSPNASDDEIEEVTARASFQTWTRNADDFRDPKFLRAVPELGKEPPAFIDQYQADDMAGPAGVHSATDEMLEGPDEGDGGIVGGPLFVPRPRLGRPRPRGILQPEQQGWEMLAGGALDSLNWDDMALLDDLGGITLPDLTPVADENTGTRAVAAGPTAQTAEMDSAFEVVLWKPDAPQGAARQQRKSFADPKLRAETSQTRKLKACVRCRQQKIRCQIDEDNPTGECKTCRAASVFKLVNGIQCLRYKITECTVFRVGKGPGLSFTSRWPVMKLKDITDWAADDIRTIKIMSNVCPVPLVAHVRKFVPLANDTMYRGWYDGKRKKWKRTEPYAVVHMAKAVDDMKKYVDTHIYSSMEFFLEENHCDELCKDTYTFARKHMARTELEDERVLMANFFRFWFAVRRTSCQEHIVGDETLGMTPELKDKSYPLFGKIPLPPVLIHQLDMVLTLGILNPLQKIVFEDFQRVVQANKPRSWMTIYLITFIALHNCGILTTAARLNARRHGLRRRYSMPQFIEELHHSANVFLSHYHYVTKSCNPFKIDWKRRQSTRFRGYTPSEIRFLHKTKSMVEERAERFRLNKELELVEDELFFIAQMFEDDWTPYSPKVDYDDGTINNAPLRIYYEDEMNLDSDTITV